VVSFSRRCQLTATILDFQLWAKSHKSKARPVEAMVRITTRTHQQKPQRLSLSGRLQTTGEITVVQNPRHDWRGFSFGGYWFSYYFFSGASPSSAARQMMPG
jgi:hypothetical protein